MKSGARPARALLVVAAMHISGPLRNNGWVALSVLQRAARNAGGHRRVAPDPGFQWNRYGCG